MHLNYKHETKRLLYIMYKALRNSALYNIHIKSNNSPAAKVCGRTIRGLSMTVLVRECPRSDFPWTFVEMDLSL